jgi:isopentenyl diphosphate isomerase/L-lactate dehydrogenase-like FMN-dependent dehydrogenase
MSQEEEIKNLTDIATETENLNIVNTVISNLAAYGPKSIPAISEIIEQKHSTQVRSYGMKTIKEIKQRSLTHHSYKGLF